MTVAPVASSPPASVPALPLAPVASVAAVPPIIQLSDVSVTYKSGEVTALRQVTLSITPGEWVFLVGPTGAGKSTLLKLLYRDMAVTSGQISVAGFDLTQLRARDVPALRRHMGIVLQDYGLLPQRTVWENIAFVCRVTGMGRGEIRKRIPEVLDLVGMAHRNDAFPGELSGGEQQRVAIARALVNHPPLLIADEPTGNLDPETGAGIMDVLQEANRRGATLVLATHDKTSVDRLRRRVIAVRAGQVVRDEASGTYGREAGD